MENAISITTSRDAQLEAASLLSKTLTDLGCAHAYIGGFAWALLGSRRLTEMSTHPKAMIVLQVFPTFLTFQNTI